ncbi:zinc dependent phospholipase C family protein [Paenibacillus macerans]|uniref:zinc dependent phospholipase C family protein n=1 Tax=Paenibacillus macerans TaxID=44252 RepID=UPI003D32379A
MPAIWMHLEYGQRLAAEFQDRFPILNELHTNRNLYHVGCQGPDFLLFHGFLSWRKPSGAVKLGNLMHSRSCGPVLIDLWRRSLTLPESVRAQAQLFFLGFLTHHLLDRNLHPYINWKAGYKRLDHQRFEIALDAVFMRRLKQVDVSRAAGWKEIDLGPGLPRPIRQILHDTVLAHYPEAVRLPFASWQEAYRDMRLAHRLLHDPSGWKKTLVAGPVRRLFYPSVPASRGMDMPDYLNEQRTEWRHSALYSEVRKDSVWELWEQALEDARRVLGALADWLNDKAPETSAPKLESFRQLLGDRSYDTGKDCGSNLVNLYAEPIWGRQRTG